jgi:predicted Zn-dependent protease
MKLRGMAAPLALALLAACATNPVTGRQELALMSESQEIELGQQAARDVEYSLGLLQDAGLQQYVRGIGSAMAALSERPNLPWRFGVIDDPVPNAFALPGGPVYVTRGLLALLDSEAQLATVLGHEIGHITARHAVSQISRAQLAQLGLGVATILRPELQALGGLLGGGAQLLLLSYGRDHERQADELGFRYSLARNYDVGEMSDVFTTLQRVGELEGRSGLPSWMSTHPDPGERARTADQRVAALPAPPTPRIVNRAEYLARINGLVYGENPRQGFFRGSEFLHPDLRFRITFPQGWTTRNLPRAVGAISPHGDALVELTLADGSVQQAAQRFFANQAIRQQGPTSNDPINGLPAYRAYFQAATDQGAVAGIATFISHGGNTYQILAYTPAARLTSHDSAFRSSVGSFATLTEAAALNVRPNRIEIVRTDVAMTLTQFNQRYPSRIPLAELAILNQTQPNVTIPAGTQLKRVVAG